MVGETVSRDLTFSKAIEHDYDDVTAYFFSSATFSGTSRADTMIFNTIAIEEGADLSNASGAGADIVTVGAISQNSPPDYFESTTVSSGTGAYVVTIAAGSCNLLVDIGDDGDADTLAFLGALYDATITNWHEGEDAVISFGAQSGVIWSVADNGLDRVFTSNDCQSFTILGAAGVLANGIAENTAAAYAQDLNGLFDDAKTVAGDIVTLSATALAAR